MQRYVKVNELVSRPGKPGRWPMSKATYWRKVKAGELPLPTKLGPQLSAVSLDVIEAVEATWTATPTDPAQKIAAGRASAAARRAKKAAEVSP